MSNKINELENSTNENIIPKKRGRKSKKEIEESLKNKINENVIIKNDDTHISMKTDETVFFNDKNEETDCNKNYDDDDNINNTEVNDKPLAKKRGRKPKGGKIVQQITPSTNVIEQKPNVILHLKCSLKDLSSYNLLGSNIDGYSFTNTNTLVFDNINNENITNEFIKQPSCDYDCNDDDDEYEHETTKNKENDIKEIWKKLKVLEHNLHINNISNKKSACFWDTCEFDNPPVYIPKHFMNDTYHVYGCFCSPECAVAYLMEENIDSSIKFERYQLMNHIYSKVYNYNKNIKPAPNPFYMLEKYYGNLSTQEYRSLLRNERLFLVVDKPLTRIMPELHEDNDDFIINNKIIPNNNIKLRKIQKKQSKGNILSEKFGLNQ